MPLVRIDLRRGKPPACKKAICDGVYRALRETFTVPEEDRFIIVNEHDGGDFVYSRNYLGIERSDALVIIQITVSNTRDVEQKQALYAKIVSLLSDIPDCGRRTSLSASSKSRRRTGPLATESPNMSRRSEITTQRPRYG
jgi:phenylpyruvate tautomerase PptA (4-oxalocrotonate tautomerase family)